MVTSVDTEEMIASMEDLKTLPGGLRVVIAIGKKRGISDSDRAQFIFGVKKIVEIMRGEFEAEDSYGWTIRSIIQNTTRLTRAAWSAWKSQSTTTSTWAMR